jgi:diaminohydroxyphosphoribosylaminopyrimidine deaminase / 5-amino-6-(5-phosphoribosylamino)uracil reductase
VKTTNKYMSYAIDLALKAEGQTAPNPLVGSVVVRNSEIISTGYHKGPGKWHAEREALLAINSSAEGADLYVNLEPCCHFGRTPPCTDIIIQSGIKRVFVGMLDPDPRMAGKGVEKLRGAGIHVVVGINELECKKINQPYLLARESNRPMFTLKVACSLDGYICSEYGESKWITGEETRLASRGLRGTHDGILVGIGTVLADNPSLTTRIEGKSNPVPIILDTNYRIPSDALVINAGRKPFVFHNTDATQSADINLIKVSSDQNGVDLDQVAAHLVSQGIYSVLLEGGGEVYRSFLEREWVDRIELFMAPIVLGAGKNWSSSIPFHLSDAATFDLYETQVYKSDIRLRYCKRKYV